MKTIFTLLLATIFTSAAFAYNEGHLTVTIAGNNDFRVVIDGRTYGNDNTIMLTDVQPGQHSIKVYRSRRNGYGRNTASKNDLLYSTTVYVKPAYHVGVMINRFGKALVDEQPLQNSLDRWERDDQYDNRNRDYGSRNNSNGSYSDGYYQAMSETEFNQLMQHIKSQWSSNAKINVAKDGIAKYFFNTYQVRQVLLQFTSEMDKLELGKLAYRNTADRRNYYQLYDVFSFQNTKDELDRYIREFRY